MLSKPRCEICNKEFSAPRDLIAHEKGAGHAQVVYKKEGIELENLQICRLCDKAFYNANKLKRHEEGALPKKKAIDAANGPDVINWDRCEPYGTRFCSRADQREHMRGHKHQDAMNGIDRTRDLKASLKCELCGLTFKDSHAKKAHEKTQKH